MGRKRRPRVTEKKELSDVHLTWEGLLKLRRTIVTCASRKANPVATGAAVFLSSIADNLLFIHAVAALNDALEYLRDRGDLNCGSNNIYSLILECQRKWPEGIDYRTLQEIREKRNALAHDGRIVDSEECWRYVDVVAKTLATLGCLPEGAKATNVLAIEKGLDDGESGGLALPAFPEQEYGEFAGPLIENVPDKAAF